MHDIAGVESREKAGAQASPLAAVGGIAMGHSHTQLNLDQSETEEHQRKMNAKTTNLLNNSVALTC